MTPHFFYISDITNSSSYSGKSFRKKSMLKKFRANVLKPPYKPVSRLYTPRPFQPGACKESKISTVFGFKSSTTLSTFTFRFLSFPLFSLSLPHFYYFQLAGHLVGFILVGRVFEKPFIILELDAQKGRWVMEQAFRSVLHWFFWPFLQFP